MSGEVRHVADININIHENIGERLNRTKELSIAILPQIDDRIYGFSKKKIITIAGRVSMGKSALLMDLAWCFAAQGHKVLFFNLETTNMEFAERLYSYVTETDNMALRTGEATQAKDYIAKANKFDELTKKSQLIISESYGKTFSEILRVVEDTGDDYDVVAIDYLQKISMNKRSERESMDEYMNKLSELAISKNICILLGS